MKASDAKKLTDFSIKDAEEKKIAEKFAREEQEKKDYLDGRKSCEWALDSVLKEIKKKASAGKTKYIYCSDESRRNAEVSEYSRGKTEGLQVSLVKLEYNVTYKGNSRFVHDCDGGGDSYDWLELHIEW